MGQQEDSLLTIWRLSQYRPFERGGASAREAIDDLIKAGLAENGGSCETLTECVDVLHTLFRINLDEVEVARSIGDLVKSGCVLRTGGRYEVSPEELVRLEAVAAESEALATEALLEWRAWLTSTWPHLNPDQLRDLEDDLRLFLHRVLSRHGIEAVLLLYPEEEEAQRLYDDLEKEGVSFIPDRDWLGQFGADIRLAALSHFVRRPTDAQRRYLAQNLNTAYMGMLLSIDPEAAEAVREVSAGQVVYLDTNFLYRLLGIQGPRHVRPAERVLELSKEAGYRMAVTPWTVAEFRRSLDGARSFLKRYPLAPDEYAAVAAEATSDEDFITAYWRQVRGHHVEVDDFVAYYEKVESHLGALGVEVVDNGCVAVERDTEQLDEESVVLERVLLPRYKHPELVAHDVKHRMLVKRLRGSGHRTFSTAGFWFLTHDSALPRYDHAASDRDGSLPFCVSMGAWFQIVNAFRPRSDDFDQTLADVLASPYVRYRRELSKRAVQAVVARVRMYEGATPDLAAAVFMDSITMGKVEQDADSPETIEAVDNAIIKAAQDAQESARLAQESAIRERERAEALEQESLTTLREAEAKHELALQNERQLKEQAVQAESDRRERALRDAEERRLKDEAAAAEALRQVKIDQVNLRRKVWRIAAAVLSIVAFLVILLIAGGGAAWSFVVGVGVVVGIWIAVEAGIRYRLPDPD
jgi:predicted nucleic acid-binding protein